MSTTSLVVVLRDDNDNILGFLDEGGNKLSLSNMIADAGNPKGLVVPGTPQLFRVNEGMVLSLTVASGGAGKYEKIDIKTQATLKTVNLGSNQKTTTTAQKGTHYYLVTTTAGSIDASVGDAVLSLSVAGQAPNGFVGEDRPVLIYGRDHPVKQTIGDATHDGTHQWFKDYGLFPYYLTTCTEPGGGSSPSDSDPSKLSWADLQNLQADGVEITSHANRHLSSLVRLCTGIGLKYTGANATATAYVTDSPRTLKLVDSATTSFDLTNASYDTVAKLQAAVNAVSGWVVSVADELTGEERSADMLVVATPGKNCKGAYGLFALSGGLIVRYKGTAYRTAFTRIFTTYIQFFGDGVLVAEYDMSSGSYNTLAKVQAAANALDGGDWEVQLLNNGGQSPIYCDGTENPIGALTTGNAQDCFQRYVWHTGGIPIAQVWRKVLKRAKDTAAANGVKFQNFSDVGGGAFTQAMWQISEFSNMSRATNALATIRPSAVPAYSAAVLPNFTYDTSSTTVTAAQYAALPIALADSPGHVVCTFLHDVLKDGSSGRNFIDWQASDGPGYMMEANMLGFLQGVKTATDAKAMNVLTQQGFFATRARFPKPPNFLFNAKWKNSGETLSGLASADAGWKIPGWRIATPTITSISIDGDGVATFSSTAGANYFQAHVWLEPGKTYHIGLVAETIAYTSGSGITVQLTPLAGWEYQNEIPVNQGIYLDEAAGSAAGVHKYFSAEITIPSPARKKAYIRSRSGGTFDLSTNKNIKLDIDGIGAIDNINCAATAVTPSATYAWEIAAAINAGIKATAAYATKSEYHNIARAENGRLILESPYSTGRTTSGARIVLSAPSTLNATTAIFGTTGGTSYPVGYFSPQGSQGLLPYVFTININATGTFRMAAPVIKEVEGVY